MIPFATQRGGGQDLATHLMNSYDNEVAEVAHIRGAVARDLHGAFKEWEVQADTLTRCDRFLYSLSINPDPKQGPLRSDQYMDYIARTEAMLGLTDQPRAIVIHTKYGRDHWHVVWSRIDAQQGRAVHMAFDRDKLMRVTRGFARDHGLTLPAGYHKSREVGQISLYEQAQLREVGVSKADHVKHVTEAWRQSDNARAFVHALADRGYILATGKRPYVLVDLYGNMNALPKLIDDKSVRTKDIRAFLERDFPAHSLPSVEEARKLVDEHRGIIERSVVEEKQSAGLAELKQSQQARRLVLLNLQAVMLQRQTDARRFQQIDQHSQRAALRSDYRSKRQAIQALRIQNRPTGLAAFLGRISGVSRLRQKIQRYEDHERARQFVAERALMRERHLQQGSALVQRQFVQQQDIERRLEALSRVDRRELASFLRDQRADALTLSRGEGNRMPSLTRVAATVDKRVSVDLLQDFAEAHRDQRRADVDLLSEFRKAAEVVYEVRPVEGNRGREPVTRDGKPPTERGI